MWEAQIREVAAVTALPVYVELTAAQVTQGALDLLAGTPLRLKYRTGGIEAHLFPTPQELGDVLVAGAAGAADEQRRGAVGGVADGVEIAALRRIETGEFGYCEMTGEPISLRRLDARPIATLTLEAQAGDETA